MNKAICFSLFCWGLVLNGLVLAADEPGDRPSSPQSLLTPKESADNPSAQACPLWLSDQFMNHLKSHIQTLVRERNEAKKAYDDVGTKQQEIAKDKQSLSVSNTTDDKMLLDKEVEKKQRRFEDLENQLVKYGFTLPITENFDLNQLNKDAVTDLLKKVFASLDHEQKQPQPEVPQTKTPSKTGTSSPTQINPDSLPNIFMGGSGQATRSFVIPIQNSSTIPPLLAALLNSANDPTASSPFSPPDFHGSSASTTSSLQFPANAKPLGYQDIFNHFQKYTKSQAEALKVLSIALQRHLSMLKAEKQGTSDNFSQCSPRILLVGPPGSGKTSTVEKMAELSGLPYVIADATHLTPAGYKGSSVSDIFDRLHKKSLDLVRAAKVPLEKQLETARAWAEKGIIFMDEVDKLCRGSRSNYAQDTSSDMDGFYTKVQHELLMCIQGSKAYHVEGQLQPWNTTRMVFILGGAFAGVEKRENLTIQDYVKMSGLSDQLVGRLNFVTEFYTLSLEALEDILRNSESSILRVTQRMWKSVYNVDLQFEEPCYKDIAEIAQKSGEGARALNKIVNELMLPFEQEAFSQRGKTVLIKQQDLKVSKEKYSKYTGPKDITKLYFS